MSERPVWAPERLHSVSPWRTSQSSRIRAMVTNLAGGCPARFPHYAVTPSAAAGAAQLGQNSELRSDAQGGPLCHVATYTVQSAMACFSDVMGSLSGTNSWAK